MLVTVAKQQRQEKKNIANWIYFSLDKISTCKLIYKP
jgi:hypothetical protein